MLVYIYNNNSCNNDNKDIFLIFKTNINFNSNKINNNNIGEYKYKIGGYKI